MSLRNLSPWLIVPALAASPAIATPNGHVGVYADSAATLLCTSVPHQTGKTLYVIAKTTGPTAAGFTGAEFRIEVSNPTGWIFSFLPAPGANVVIGNPMDTTPGNDASGLNISFPTCKASSDSLVRIGTVFAYNMNGGPTSLLVKRHNTPSNALFQCPLFVLCADADFDLVCMSPSTESPCSTLTTTKPLTLASGDAAIVTGFLDARLVRRCPPCPRRARRRPCCIHARTRPM